MTTLYSTFYDMYGTPHSYISSGYTGSASSTISFINPASSTLDFAGSTLTNPLNQTYIPTGVSNSETFWSSGPSDIINLKYNYGPGYIETIINTIPDIGIKIVPKNSIDVITFEDINEGDILINFNRYNNKTEYDCGAYYKESSLKNILLSKKNPFTMKELDISSFTKYKATF